jgi:hypothetical protein
MKANISKIVNEWSYRLSLIEDHDGFPDIESYSDLTVLKSVLSDYKWPIEITYELLYNMEHPDSIKNIKEDKVSIVKKIVLSDKFYEWLEEKLNEDEEELIEARIYQSKYSAGDVFQISSDSGISTFGDKKVLVYDEESKDFKDSGKTFNAKQVFTKQTDANSKDSSVYYVIIGKGGTEVTMKGSDGNVYVLDAAKSNLALFSKATAPTAINWTAESLEAAAGLGIYMDGANYADKLQTYMKAKNAAAVGRVIGELKKEALSALGKGAFTTKGVSAITSKADTADGSNWYLLALLAAGMNDFKHNNLGKTVVHNKIKDYYKALDKNELVDTSGAKANTADMIITNATSDDALIKLISEPNKDGHYRFISYTSDGICEVHVDSDPKSKKEGTKFVQMSMKKEEGGAQLGKITSLVRDYFDMKDNKGYLIDFVGEKEDEGFFSKALDKVKSIGKKVIAKITEFASKLYNIGTKFLNKWKGEKGKKSTIDNFFSNNKAFAPAVKKAIKEGWIKGEYINGNLLLEKTVKNISFDDKLRVLAKDKKALTAAIKLTQKDVNTLKGASSAIAIAVKVPKKLKTSAKMDIESIYKLMGNYVSVDLLNSMLKDGKKQIKPVNEILKAFVDLEKEMKFGKSSLPIWKVYGRKKENSKASHENLGGATEFVDEKVEDLIGNVDKKVIFGTLGNYQSSNYYAFHVFIVSGVDDKNKGLLYTESRIGSNAGDANFSWIFEGTEVRNEDWVTSRVL